MSTLEHRAASDAAVGPVDHYDGLRQQRRTHMQNAQWWKKRYRAWGGNMALQWFQAEARSHRNVSRTLWAKGLN